MIATSGDWCLAGPQTNREGTKAGAKAAGPRQAGGRSADRGLSDPSVGAVLQSCAISPQSPEVPTALRLMLGPDPRASSQGHRTIKQPVSIFQGTAFLGWGGDAAPAP